MPDALTPGESIELQRLIGAPIFFPDEFKTWLTDFIGTNIPLIPYSQFFGAPLNTARSGQTILTSESTGSTTYTDLATVGPQVTGLQDGTYMVLFGCALSAQGAYVSLSVNGATASDNDAIHESEHVVSGGKGVFVTAKNLNNNSIKMVYKKEGGGSAVFYNRWMSVLRIGAG